MILMYSFLRPPINLKLFERSNNYSKFYYDNNWHP